MKHSEAKRRIPKKGKHHVNPRALKAAEMIAAGVPKATAAAEAGLSPTNINRTMTRAGTADELREQLRAHGVTPELVAQIVARLCKGTKFVSADAAGAAVLAGQKDKKVWQREFFDDATWLPKATAVGVVADLAAQEAGVKLATQFMGVSNDPERERKLFEAGVEAGTRSCMELIMSLQKHLTAEGENVLAEGVRKMSGGTGN